MLQTIQFTDTEFIWHAEVNIGWSIFFLMLTKCPEKPQTNSVLVCIPVLSADMVSSCLRLSIELQLGMAVLSISLMGTVFNHRLFYTSFNVVL